MVIRPVQRTDHEQWLPLWDGYNAFYELRGNSARQSVMYLPPNTPSESI